MAVRKVAETPVDAETPVTVDEGLVITEQPVTVRKYKPRKDKYVSKRLSMAHPYQKIMLYPGVPVELDMDSWLFSQIQAGLVSKCE